MFFLALLFTFLLPQEEAVEICPCQIHSEEMQSVINKMKTVAEQTGKSFAAPLIGEPKTILVIHEKESLRILINPKVVEKSLEKTKEKSSCPVCQTLPAYPEKILLQAYLETGDILIEEIDGELAQQIQHQIEHLL